jgi:hypothetical protein
MVHHPRMLSAKLDRVIDLLELAGNNGYWKLAAAGESLPAV